MANLIRIFIALVIISGLSFSVYWLWQRQPKNPDTKEQVQTDVVIKNDKETSSESQTLVTSPPQWEILGSVNVKIAGNAASASTALIYSDNLNSALAITPEGNFAYDVTLKNGLNILNIVALNSELKETHSQIFNIFVSSADADEKLYFRAGIVKKIFENTLTVTTSSGEIEITTNSSTVYANTAPPTPTKSPPPKNSNDNDIRVADYIVAVGKEDKNNLKAKKIEIYRANKPSVDKTYSIVKIASPSKSNIFSATNTKDNKLLEFTLDKNTQILEKDKKVTTALIIKDKTAIVFYQTEDKENLVLKIHIL